MKQTVPPDDLDTLRGECQRFTDARDREMDRLGVDIRSTMARQPLLRPRTAGAQAVERFLSSDLRRKSPRRRSVDTVYLFNEQTS